MIRKGGYEFWVENDLEKKVVAYLKALFRHYPAKKEKGGENGEIFYQNRK